MSAHVVCGDLQALILDWSTRPGPVASDIARSMPLSHSRQAFQLRTLFMGSLGSIPESHARTVDKKLLAAWVKQGLIEHRLSEKYYALTAKGEKQIG